ISCAHLSAISRVHGLHGARPAGWAIIRYRAACHEDGVCECPAAAAVSLTWMTGVEMPIVSMRQLLDHAAENGYGIPAFNVNNLEQVQAIMSAASEIDAPVIMQASAGA